MVGWRRLLREAAIAVVAIGLLGAASSGAAERERGYLDGRAGNWISLSGTIESVAGDSFTLDYGEKSQDVIVEMDYWKWHSEPPKTLIGKKVSVTGRIVGGIGGDPRGERRIEASSIYLDGVYHYADPSDQAGGYYAYPLNDLFEDGDWVTLRGTVADIGEGQFKLDTGAAVFRVHVDEMALNPLDKKFGKQLEVGDKVSVYGKMDSADLFEAREIKGRSVTILVQDLKRGS